MRPVGNLLMSANRKWGEAGRKLLQTGGIAMRDDKDKQKDKDERPKPKERPEPPQPLDPGVPTGPPEPPPDDGEGGE